ncbi:MAG: PadR family transcriptional regulator [Planctomycetes bacterium]|nr:PadR family transcriptional regulator [Planctomycetota bacterium]
MTEIDQTFEGFGTPKENWSKLPHTLIAELPTIKSASELKVILYILRHTWGYHEIEKRISLDEFAHGRKKRGGERLDNGTGMSIPSIRDGIKRAVEHGFITVETDDSDKARVKKYYSLNQTVRSLQSDCKEVTPRVQETYNRTKKETPERNLETHFAQGASESVQESPQEETTQPQDEFCPDCDKPLCTSEQTPRLEDCCACRSEQVLTEAFGARTREPVAPPTHHYSEKIHWPWIAKSDGRFKPRSNASIEAMEHVLYLVNHITGKWPTSSQWKHWNTQCGEIYEAGSGDWGAIEQGIVDAWQRDPRYRPQNIRGFVDPVSNAFADRNQTGLFSDDEIPMV